MGNNGGKRRGRTRRLRGVAFSRMASSALITGGTGGLGAAVTQAFLEGGWRVVVPVFDEAERERVPAHERLVLEPADLSDADSTNAVTALAAADGDAPLRAVVNLVGGFAAAGACTRRRSRTSRPSCASTCARRTSSATPPSPHMLAAGGGAIVCVSSRAALQPFSGAAGYIVAKAAVLAFVDVLARSTAMTASAPTPSCRASSTHPPTAARCPTPTTTAGSRPSRSPPSCGFCARTAPASSAAHTCRSTAAHSARATRRPA